MGNVVEIVDVVAVGSSVGFKYVVDQTPHLPRLEYPEDWVSVRFNYVGCEWEVDFWVSARANITTDENGGYHLRSGLLKGFGGIRSVARVGKVAGTKGPFDSVLYIDRVMTRTPGSSVVIFREWYDGLADEIKGVVDEEVPEERWLCLEDDAGNGLYAGLEYFARGFREKWWVRDDEGDMHCVDYGLD